MASSGVQVVVRIRPLNEREKKHGTLPVISASTNDKTVTVLRGTGGRQARSQYAFDNVFTAFSTQEEVFQTTLKPVIKDVMKGFESTVFAYGQTGTGKTHTMEGSLEDPDYYGVIPRAAEAIFEELNNEELNYESFKVYSSYLEIYNEDLSDLFVENNTPTSSNTGPRSPKRSRTQKLEIMEGREGPFCRGLSEKEVNTAGDLLDLMQNAQLQRRTAETNMNKQSSRSHCIFTLRVEAKRRLADGALFETRGKLHMVDLAGSECAKTANTDDGGGHRQLERERMNINRSLLTLGRVVKLLKEQSTKSKPGNVRIPYRDSKLTRILQQALGGNSKTVIIGTLSPSVTSIEESISTLNYAQAAHGIINKPVSASYLSEGTKNSALLSAMEGSTSGAQSLEHWKEMEVRLEYMKCQVEEAKAALARKHLQQQEIVERAEKAEAEKTAIEEKMNVLEEKVDSLQVELVQAEEKQQATENELNETRATLEKTTIVLHATQKTESSLTNEALALIDALKQSVADGDRLHAMVLANRESDVERRGAAKELNGSIANLLTNVKQALNALSEEGSIFQNKSSDLANAAASKETQFLEDTKAILRNAVESVASTVATLKASIHEEDGIVPTVDMVNTQAFSRVGNVWSLLESSEQNLMAQFNSTRQQLTEFGTRLNELENAHNVAAEETISVLEENVASSKQRVEDLVSSTNAALEKASEDRKKIRDATMETVEQWKLSMINSGDIILKESTTQRDRTEKTKSLLTSEMQRHVNIETHLNNQGSLLENSRTACVSAHGAQKELLLQTQSTMEASHNNQTQLLSSFVQKLMKDVENLVQNQVSEVIQEVNSGHACFVDNSNSLVENHASITSSTLGTLEKAGELKSSIQEEAEAAKENDKTVIAHLGETRSLFANLEIAVNDHQTNVASFASATVKNLKESEDLEIEDTKVCEKLSTEGNECLIFMSESINEAANRVCTQTEAGKSIASFTKSSVLTAATTAVDEMEKPRSEVMSEFAQECSGLEECFEKGLAQIKEKASVSSNIADKLHMNVKSIESQFVDTTAEERSAEIAQTKSSFLAHGTEHAESITKHIGSADDGSTKATTAVESFVKVDLSAFEEVADAPDKGNILYSDQLSSTPSENDILAAVKKLGTMADVSTVLQALHPNQDKVSSGANKKVHRGRRHTVPNFQHERNEPRGEQPL